MSSILIIRSFTDITLCNKDNKNKKLIWIYIIQEHFKIPKIINFLIYQHNKTL